MREVLTRIKDLELSMELTPHLQGDKEIPKVYFESNLLREASASMKTIMKKYDINGDFKLCIIKAAVDRYYLFDYISAVTYYKKAMEIDPTKAEYIEKQINVLEIKIREAQKGTQNQNITENGI